ncbi:lipase 3-like [Pieris rapae]|uniref:lipase 3-like n=1 Tax=Pieris rapae TaxID=64459 RepID=UPI001E27FC0D|nr:lipase 3-like [Pieris rapae]
MHVSYWAFLCGLFVNCVYGEEKTPRRSTAERIALTGHRSEEHYVTTDDGYVLTVFRIPGSRGPILLMHGILDTSDTWVLRGNNSLAITLANLGYDVWLGNCRGNFYSKDHVKLNATADAKAYWNFSFHESGLYDLPATIDLVLKETGVEKLNTIGHSQGTTIFFVMGSLRPEYNDKINVLLALAPIAHLQNVPPPLSSIIKVAPALEAVLSEAKQYYLLGDSPSGKAARSICNNPLYGYPVCAYGVAFPVVGTDAEEYPPAIHYEAFNYYPDNVAVKSLYHFAQVSLRKQFAQYDNGALENLKIYGSVSPPKYDLSKVKMPVALLCGANDKLSTLDDVALLRAALPNVIQYTVLNWKRANHLDLVWGKTMEKYLFPDILKILARYKNLRK